MAALKYPGTCYQCDKTFSKAGMSNHLKACLKSQQTSAGGKTHPTYWLSVWGSYYNEYWLHLEIRADTTLDILDQFLRDIWLECCGHLSSFTIDGIEYMVNTGMVDDMWLDPYGTSEPIKTMDTKLSSILRPGLGFNHIYDFGTTTYLSLKVNAQTTSTLAKDEVKLLARNLPPKYKCFHCDKTASQVCGACMYKAEGWVCDDCAELHACDEDYFLPVVNSPRVGECGYTG